MRGKMSPPPRILPCINGMIAGASEAARMPFYVVNADVVKLVDTLS
jgi:hypothetical protein